MDSVKFPRRTTRIVEVEEYLKRLGATASAETAKEVVSGLSSGINEGAVLENNVVDEVYEFESAPKTEDAATQTKWPNLGNRKQTKDVGVQMEITTNDVSVQMPNTTDPASMLNKMGMIQYPNKKKSTSPYPAMMTRGRGGVWLSPENDDVIYEQPLKSSDWRLRFIIVLHS